MSKPGDRTESRAVGRERVEIQLEDHWELIFSSHSSDQQTGWHVFTHWAISLASDSLILPRLVLNSRSSCFCLP